MMHQARALYVIKGDSHEDIIKRFASATAEDRKAVLEQFENFRNIELLESDRKLINELEAELKLVEGRP